ncbi:MAG: HAD-IC family P-type ATPase [Polyangiales bacterium]
MPDGRTDYCCGGCSAAHALLQGMGLQRYYDLREGTGLPAVQPRMDAESAGFEVLCEDARGGGSVRVSVQGMHCAACVWLVEELFHRQTPKGRIDVDPARGEARIVVPEGFELSEFRGTLGSLGYGLGPPGAERQGDDLLWRLGFCAALAINAMLIALASYFGLGDAAGEEHLRAFMDRASFGASALAVVLGGPVFFRSAFGALRRGMVGLDLPISIGVLLAFAGASARYFFEGDAAYVDTLAIFVTLMLGGRWLQERALERNRRRLLSDSTPESMLTRVVDAAGKPRVVSCASVRVGDELLIGPGDLLPVDAKLMDAASFSLEWLNGESTEKHYEVGSMVPSGAFSTSGRAIRAEALAVFADSLVPQLLRETRDVGEARSFWWQRLGAIYSLLVLVIAGLGGAFTYLRSDGSEALQVVTALLVVTCPCAFGIAVPLAREIAHAHLRSQGLYVRTASFLDRLQEVRRVVFDKTGTLTTGNLGVTCLRAPSETHREVLARLASSSMHPKSRVLHQALGAQVPFAEAESVAGSGVRVVVDGTEFRLGSAAFALAQSLPDPLRRADVVFSRDHELLAAYETHEELRHDAVAEIRLLGESKSVAILSGDQNERVSEVASTLGLHEALGEQSPRDKANYVSANDPKHTLMVGDGLNDHLALLEARCAGTPAIDRPFVANRCDFYLSASGIAPIRRAFDVAEWLRLTQRRLLWIAVFYNTAAIALAFSGHMSPWLAAVLMPTSSLVTLAFVGLRARAFSAAQEPTHLSVTSLVKGTP